MIPLRHKLTRGSFTLDVDVEIPDTGITGVFGESGSGKTTLLRCIAGLEQDGRSPGPQTKRWLCVPGSRAVPASECARQHRVRRAARYDAPGRQCAGRGHAGHRRPAGSQTRIRCPEERRSESRLQPLYCALRISFAKGHRKQPSKTSFAQPSRQCTPLMPRRRSFAWKQALRTCSRGSRTGRSGASVWRLVTACSPR